MARIPPKYSYSLLEYIDSLHRFARGSSDELSNDEAVLRYHTVMTRIREWQHRPPAPDLDQPDLRVMYDRHVLAMANVVVVEFMKAHPSLLTIEALPENA